MSPVVTTVAELVVLISSLKSQIDWYLEQSALIAPIERPFTPDGAKDMGGIWETRRDEKRLAKPNGLMFFHIPLCVFLASPAYSSLSIVDDIGQSHTRRLMYPIRGRRYSMGSNSMKTGLRRKTVGSSRKGY